MQGLNLNVTLAAFSEVKLQYVSPAYKVKIGKINSICISTKQIITTCIYSSGDGWQGASPPEK
jgi:hypothetical protein